MTEGVLLAADGSPHPQRGAERFDRDVRAMFTRIAGQYTFFDHLATFGQDLVWRPRALWDLDRVLERPPERVLDLGCGPGDLTYLLADHYPQATVVAADFTPAMVRRAERLRAEVGARGARVRFGIADVLRLPFAPRAFDMVTSAFLIRNLPQLEMGLAEMCRVLRPGGVALALEITEPAPVWFRAWFHTYFDRVMPKLGALFGTEGPYRYLSESLRAFPSREGVMEAFRRAGFRSVEARLQSAGSVTTFLARA
ncbi:MAG: ubiquinone/menaquinone biosynthesis methyltransferase [Euryarchaeota archaeon]|nr:ubiquinone/menaquinone biosynthesis methyltransferase [Euryarchaeota archaeon]MDE1837012.1 ubiquinone/menaquinone biosynthesis methyltransferase [Euryarchaeota archaeon]MDE1879862.1 ubiquinone/menaquinone biosynthesis methyltransferase [Euryarchaeota archaeon]MDE2045670.1 ubiquinone/menaquinone biosynthesis methyltransferase [Thermoplasmata archaeon]